MPLFFLLLGLYKQRGKLIYLLTGGICMGIIIQFHYQMVLGLLIVLLWMKFFLKISFTKLALFIGGIIIGFSPLLIFELRNNFYNLNTLIFFAGNFSKLGESNSGLLSHPHYYLSLLLIVFVLIVSWVKKIPLKAVYGLIGLLVIWDIFTFIPRPDEGFGMSKNWHYGDEKKVFEIIKEQNLESYNFTNLEYDSLYHVQKYFHQTAGIDSRVKDYWEADKLFAVIKKDEDPDKDSAYEIQVFKPYKELRQWEINNYYRMYLFEKSRPLQGN
jgi:hypothetical protein